MPTARAVALAALSAASLAPASAGATFHLVKVREVFPGSAAHPAAQYVELQAYASFQNFVHGHALLVFDASGAQIGSFSFPTDVANGANQATFLVATTEAAALFGVTADLAMTPILPAAGGKVCWDSSRIDCVSWGAYDGPPDDAGPAFNAQGGLALGRASRRRIDRGDPTRLEDGDDTNDSGQDFLFAAPAPRNNAGQTGVTPASTCGNGTAEGVEGCDDGDANDCNGCTGRCEVATVVGTSAGESLDGTLSDDVILGLGGSDTIQGRAGNDLLCGGGGLDLLLGGGGADTLRGGGGDDTLKGGGGADVLLGGRGNDEIRDTRGANQIDGGAGTDHCVGSDSSSLADCETF